jgi:hypothetical protein
MLGLGLESGGKKTFFSREDSAASLAAWENNEKGVRNQSCTQTRNWFTPTMVKKCLQLHEVPGVAVNSSVVVSVPGRV